MKIINSLRVFSLLLLLGSFTACDNPASTGQTDQPIEPISTSSGNPAIDGLTQKIAEDPNNPSFYAHRAGAWLEMEGYDEAIADLQKAISLDSLQPEYHHELANIYMDYYKSRQAMMTMEKAGELFPKRIPTLLKMAEFQLILKQYDRALYSLERIRVIEPNNPEMFFMFGNVFQEMDRIPESKGAFQSAIEQNPELVDAYVKLGQIFINEKNEVAGRYLDNALRIAPNHIGALHAKGNFLSQIKDDLPGAIANFKKINVINPQFEEGYYNLGLLYLDADSLDQAYQTFDLAIKVAPDYAESYFFRGMASKLKGDKVSAKRDFEQSLRLKPDYEYAINELANL